MSRRRSSSPATATPSPGRRRSSRRSGSAHGSITTRRSSRAASSSAWRSRGRRWPGPEILLADEPTGNLDEATGEAIVRLLFDLRDRHGATLVLVTHAPELAARCDRVVRLRDGRRRDLRRGGGMSRRTALEIRPSLSARIHAARSRRFAQPAGRPRLALRELRGGLAGLPDSSSPAWRSGWPRSPPSARSAPRSRRAGARGGGLCSAATPRSSSPTASPTPRAGMDGSQLRGGLRDRRFPLDGDDAAPGAARSARSCR